MKPDGASIESPTPSRTQVKTEEVISFLKTLVVLIAIVILVRGTIVEPYQIPSGSMFPTLREGDRIFVIKYPYGFRLPGITYTLYQYSSPKRGDVVVFTRPDDPNTPDEDDSAINIIKRVVGLPGDTVEVRRSEGRPRVFINNQILDEPYARWDLNGIREGEFGPAKVPEGKILLLGDNRDHSKDSRFWTDHFLDIGRVKGRAVIVYWSWDSFSRIGTIIR